MLRFRNYTSGQVHIRRRLATRAPQRGVHISPKWLFEIDAYGVSGLNERVCVVLRSEVFFQRQLCQLPGSYSD